MLLPPSFHESPTTVTLAAARSALDESLAADATLAGRIADAEAALAQIVAEAQAVIDDLRTEKQILQNQILQTRAYLAPIRRLPGELLRELFLRCFESHPCCAWILSAVCATWRQQALSIPQIWSKIRLVTNQTASPDTIRLWLERSGSLVPLDIEIYLRVSPSECAASAASPYPSRGGDKPSSSTRSPPRPPRPCLARRRRIHLHLVPTVTPFIVPQPSALHWEAPPGHDGAAANQHWGHIAVFYLVQQMHRWQRFVFRFDKGFSSLSALKSITGPAPLLREFEVSCAAPALYHPAEWAWLPAASAALPSLRSLTLQYAPFKPTASVFLQPYTHLTTLNIRALPATLVPLDRILGIRRRARAAHRLAAGRTTTNGNINGHPHMHNLVQNVNGLSSSSNVVTPNTVVLPQLAQLAVGGHHLLAQLVDALAAPLLDVLDLDLESPREPLEEGILEAGGMRAGDNDNNNANNSTTNATPTSSATNNSASNNAATPPTPRTRSPRSPHPCLHTPTPIRITSPTITAGAGPVVSWNFLHDVGGALEVLRVGNASLEGVVSVLGGAGDGGGGGGGGGGIQVVHHVGGFVGLMGGGGGGGGGSGGNGAGPPGGWACPQLRELYLRGCHAHPHHHHGHGADGVGRLVRMVGGRNPDGGGGGWNAGGSAGVQRLTRLEMEDCVSLGGDVLAWLESRIGRGGVVCVEPPVMNAPGMGMGNPMYGG
ncbi:hypothetical protein C8J57DRAFT_1714611 [Mycena rebaudengoi]|nr:hypothetical protein C8J57DRAFT_1714611 [Mycena rebaudengoi]